MNWYEGSIAEAINLSKQRNAIFVVYVEGNDELSLKLRGFINEKKIKDKLESEHFVAIKIDSGSQAYMQFAQIYQLVPLPSIFFIGKNGAPIQVVTGVISTSDELESKILTVLDTLGIKPSDKKEIDAGPSTSTEKLESPSATSSQDLIINEQSASDIICKDGVCYRKPKETESTKDTENTSPQPPVIVEADTSSSTTKESSGSSKASSAEKPEITVERARKIMEQKRKELEEEEARLERTREIQRRKDGQQMQNMQKLQKEQELQQLKETIRRERLEEQAARQRILEKIASDRAEQVHKKFNTTPEPTNPPATAEEVKPKPAKAASASTRIQFRKPSGEIETHTFNSSDAFSVVRSYVETKLLADSGVKKFTLAKTFPRKEFTTEDDTSTLVELGLCPTAVLLVIVPTSPHSPAAIVARSGGIINIFHTVFWGVLSPFFFVYDCIRRFFNGDHQAGADRATSGQQKRANEDKPSDHEDIRRRNIEKFLKNSKLVKDDVSTSADKTKKEGAYRRLGGSNIHRLHENQDSDDENNTWNGNSTQQQ